MFLFDFKHPRIQFCQPVKVSSATYFAKSKPYIREFGLLALVPPTAPAAPHEGTPPVRDIKHHHATMSTTAGIIPRPYRIFFTIIDPVIASLGLLIHLQPAQILPSYAPEPTLPALVETRLLLDGLVGFFAMAVVLEVVLLRARPDDVVVWKILQAAIACTDVGMLGGFYRALSATGRLSVQHWRFEEWNNITVIGFCGLVRVLFCLGVGLPRRHQKTA